MRRRGRRWMGLAAVWAAGCGGDGDGVAVSMSRDTLPGGTPVARYGDLSGAPVDTLTADLRIGQADGTDPHCLFGDVRGIEAGADGTVYVLDYQASEIRAFDPEGRFVRTVAARGQGPGEIVEANGMLMVGDSLLWVYDHGAWQVLALRPEGGEVTRTPPPVRSYGYVWQGTVTDDGRHWKPTAHSDEERGDPPEEGLQESTARSYLVHHDPATGVRDSVHLGDVVRRTHVSANARGGYSYRGIPFDAAPLTAVDPAGGVWHTANRSYRIARLDESGDTTLVIEADVDPLPVTSGDRSAYVDAAVERQPSVRRTVEEIVSLAGETKPVFERLFVDGAGRLWAGRNVPEGETPLYDVFSRDGTMVGSYRLGFAAAPYLPVRVRHGHLYAVVRDSLDVPTVVRAPLPDEGRP